MIMTRQARAIEASVLGEFAGQEDTPDEFAAAQWASALDGLDASHPDTVSQERGPSGEAIGHTEVIDW